MRELHFSGVLFITVHPRTRRYPGRSALIFRPYFSKRNSRSTCFGRIAFSAKEGLPCLSMRNGRHRPFFTASRLVCLVDGVAVSQVKKLTGVTTLVKARAQPSSISIFHLACRGERDTDVGKGNCTLIRLYMGVKKWNRICGVGT